MRVAVAGGTGAVGRYVVAALEAAGHEAVVLARSRGVDLTTGKGLAAALAGTTAVVDTVNKMTMSEKAATEFFTTTSQHLLDAEVRAGVGHHVLLSIAGADRVPGYTYFRAKLAQERVVRAGEVPWSVVRATQFFEFAGQMLAMLPGPVGVVPRMRCRPIAAREVGGHLATVAAGTPVGVEAELAGPAEEQMVDMARRLLAVQGRRRWVLPISIPGAGADMRGGALLPLGDGPRGSVTFEEWLGESQS